MFSVLRRLTLTRPTLMKAIQENHRSTIYSKPPKENIGPVGHAQGLLQSLAQVGNIKVQRDTGNIMQSVIAICAFAVTILGPAGWIMHHIPEYRQRSPPQP